MPFYYYKPENIIKEISEAEAKRLTDNGSGTIDMEKIVSAENSAEITINAYLEGRYSLPFDNDNLPPIITIIARDLAIVNLYEAAIAKGAIPDAVKQKKADCYKLLKFIQNGDIQLNWTESHPPFISVRKNIY